MQSKWWVVALGLALASVSPARGQVTAADLKVTNTHMS